MSYRDDRGGGGGGFRRPPRDVDRMHSLRVGNLPFSAMADDLMPLFEKYGDVGDVYLPKERDTGRSRGFAFVRYHEKRDAEDAIDALDGRQYDGRELKISMDAGRPQRDGDRGGYGGGGGGGFGGGGGGRRRSRSRSPRRKRSPSRSRSRSRGKRDRSGDREKSGDRRRSKDRSGSPPSRNRSRS